MTPFSRAEIKALHLKLADVAVGAEISYDRMARAFYGTADHLTPEEIQRALRVIVRARNEKQARDRQAERDAIEDELLV